MKKLLTILAFYFSASYVILAQDALARIKYEEAEQAFAQSDFHTALKKIGEVEDVLKSSNQKTLFLKILSEYQLFKDDYSYIKSLKTNCNSYLTLYSNNQSIFEKYKEIYKINEEIKDVSDTPEAIEQEIQKKVMLKKQMEEAEQFYIKTEIKNMVFVKGGAFNMGCTGKRRGCQTEERPVHQVTLGDYYIGETEVTLGSFRTFIKDTGYQTDAEKGGGSYIWNGTKWEVKQGIDWRCDETGKVRLSSEGNYPVLHVSWNDAVAFCDWLSEKQGVRYRLPTEAEWEYAARGGKESRGYQYSGSNSLEEVGWYGGNSGGRSHPVKGKRPNELGLYDMSGNVWEWCSDWYGDYSSAPQTNPMGAASGSGRVYRGGSWNFDPALCRVAFRGNNAPGDRFGNLGFRLARTE